MGREGYADIGESLFLEDMGLESEKARERVKKAGVFSCDDSEINCKEEVASELRKFTITNKKSQ